MMLDTRASGILMHISSLPSPHGIGTFGQAAYDFVDFLVETKQTYWQILPLTTTSYGDSPYQSFSAIAGNTHFIDLDLLTQSGWLKKEDYAHVNFGDYADKVDYARLFEKRRPILEKAVSNFLKDSKQLYAFEKFKEINSNWLIDYADFMAIKEYFNHKALSEWNDTSIILRDEKTLEKYRAELANTILYHQVTQFFFFTQWQKLKNYANDNHIKIIGDMPIYVSADSVEVWTKPELFKLDNQRKPLYVAGCPADDFSDDGQLWGNPIYNWENHAKSNYEWWVDRIKESFKIYDCLRIDHFKGFSDYWEIPANSQSANNGTWQPGPYYDLFKEIEKQLGKLPIIAENLGYIDERAKKLLSDCNFPGMKILQFGFFDTEGKSIDIAHRCIPNSVAYTGTHDNDVINGWYEKLSPKQIKYVNEYTNRSTNELISQAMLRTLFATVSHTVIATMQDILDLPATTRFNLPATVGENWQWRLRPEDITNEKKEFLIKITTLYERGNIQHDDFYKLHSR